MSAGGYGQRLSGHCFFCDLAYLLLALLVFLVDVFVTIDLVTGRLERAQFSAVCVSIDPIALVQFFYSMAGNVHLVFANEVSHRIIIFSSDFYVVTWHEFLL